MIGREGIGDQKVCPHVNIFGDLSDSSKGSRQSSQAHLSMFKFFQTLFVHISADGHIRLNSEVKWKANMLK
jgi:hypothetical protein